MDKFDGYSGDGVPGSTVKVLEEDCSSDKTKDGSIPGRCYTETHSEKFNLQRDKMLTGELKRRLRGLR